MTNTNALEKPKTYETVPSSRSEAVNSSLDLLGDTFTNYLGRIGMEVNNYLFDLEQNSPKMGKFARIAAVPVAYGALSVARAAATGFFDHVGPELLAGDPLNQTDTIFIGLDTKNGTLFGIVPPELDGTILHINSPGYQELNIPITPDSHTFGAIQTEFKMGNDVVKAFSPVDVPDSPTMVAAENEHSGSYANYIDSAGNFVAPGKNSVDVVVSDKGITGFNASDKSKLYDLILKAKINGKIYGYEGQGASSLTGDILTGRLLPKLENKYDGVKTALSDFASYLSA